MEKQNNLFVIRFGSLGQFLIGVDKLAKHQLFCGQKPTVFEQINFGTYVDLIFSSEYTPSEFSAGDVFKNEYAFIANAHPELMKAFYHLTPAADFESVVVFESKKLGSLLRISDQALKAGMQCLDFACPRFSNADITSVFGANKQKIAEFCADISDADVCFSQITDPSFLLKDLYII